jgi:sulfur-oxidizing protein SoxZ
MGEKRTRVLTKTTDDGATEVVVLVSHPMETGLRVNPQTKEKIPAHFIQKITFLLNGKEVAVADAGQGVSKDPLISIRIKKTKRGDKVKVTWSDNLGEKDETEITIDKGA